MCLNLPCGTMTETSYGNSVAWVGRSAWLLKDNSTTHKTGFFQELSHRPRGQKLPWGPRRHQNQEVFLDLVTRTVYEMLSEKRGAKSHPRRGGQSSASNFPAVVQEKHQVVLPLVVRERIHPERGGWKGC